MRKRSLTNVRAHIEHVNEFLNLIEEYGMCPLAKEELPKLRFIGKCILRKHDAARAASNRKDLRIEAAREAPM